MSGIRHFSDLLVWRRSHQLFLDVVADVERMPPGQVAGILTGQIVRSAASISANIAEGFARSRKKYLNSLDIAVGEAAEFENWLYKLRDLGMIDRQSASQRIRESIEIQKMIHGLKRSISEKG